MRGFAVVEHEPWHERRAYHRLGYALCGVDTLYYGSYMPGESAIYLAKPL